VERAGEGSSSQHQQVGLPSPTSLLLPSSCCLHLHAWALVGGPMASYPITLFPPWTSHFSLC
jgi:hypothetical protein